MSAIRGGSLQRKMRAGEKKGFELFLIWKCFGIIYFFIYFMNNSNWIKRREANWLGLPPGELMALLWLWNQIIASLKDNGGCMSSFILNALNCGFILTQCFLIFFFLQKQNFKNRSTNHNCTYSVILYPVLHFLNPGQWERREAWGGGRGLWSLNSRSLHSSEIKRSMLVSRGWVLSL